MKFQPEQMQGTPSHFRRYGWVRTVLVGFLVILVAGLAYHAVTFQKAEVFDLKDRLTQDTYPQRLSEFREKYVKHLKNQTYLDYTGAGIYSNLDIHQFGVEALTSNWSNGYAAELEQNIIDTTRSELLSFLGTNSKEYSVVFVASATQALKLIGETYPWDEKKKFVYTKFNHNSVLGIRKYATGNNGTFAVIDSSKEIVPSEDTLYAVALEENFAGRKLGIEEMKRLSHTNGIEVIADSAAYLPTNRLNLTETPFHACVMSFYKIFGFPNFGALVVRNDFAKKLMKKTFTSNSVDVAFADRAEFKLHEEMPFKLEDDIVNTEMARGALIGLKSISRINIDNVNKHVWRLTQKLYNGIKALKHPNGAPASVIYGNHEMKDPDFQGGIVAFNMKKSGGEFIGYAQVVSKAKKARVHLRGGCHCNPGACFDAVGLTEDKVEKYYDAKTTCGDNNDIVDGIPLGSVRASLGWATTDEDVDAFLHWLENEFVENDVPL